MILETDQRTAMNRRLREEWLTHAGPYATRWLRAMIARKRFISNNESWSKRAEFDSVAKAHLKSLDFKNVEKDVHLVELAMLTTQRVLSLDMRQLKLLRLVAQHFSPIRNLHWVAPTKPGVLEWLAQGAPKHTSYCIRPLKAV